MICIIPASGASTRFPKKNIALLYGKPLLAYAVEAALKSNVFESVYVSSEDDNILNIALRYGATPLVRSPELASDRAQIRHVCLDILGVIDCKEFGVLGIPNPLRTAKDIKDAYVIFKHSDADCLMSVSKFKHPPQRAVWIPDGFVEPYFGVEHMRRAQKLEPLWRCDGSIIFAETIGFKEVEDFYKMLIVPYFTPEDRSVDIDYREELEWVRWKLDYEK